MIGVFFSFTLKKKPNILCLWFCYIIVLNAWDVFLLIVYTNYICPKYLRLSQCPLRLYESFKVIINNVLNILYKPYVLEHSENVFFFAKGKTLSTTYPLGKVQENTIKNTNVNNCWYSDTVFQVILLLSVNICLQILFYFVHSQ